MATRVADRSMCRSCNASVGGVCAGLAERFELDPIVVRILAVFVTLLTAGLGLIVYAVLWARLPRGSEPDVPYDVLPESAESSSFGCVDCATGRTAGGLNPELSGGSSLFARLGIAVGLMLLFLVVASNLSPMMPGTEWWQFWPLALIMAGLCLIIIPVPVACEAAWHALGIVVTSVAAMLLPISLDIISWETVPYAFSQVWPLFVAAAALFVAGVRYGNDALVIGSSFFIVAFCVYALTLCAMPGGEQMLLLQMPDGRLLRISIVG